MPRERAHLMFAALSANLGQVTGDFSGKILCPLCLQPMPEDWIDLKEPRITEEHIIPETLGGTVVTLTCKKCNSTHGTQLDSHLIQMIRSHDSLAGAGAKPLFGRMHLGGKPLPIDINLNAATKTIEFKMRRGHPSVPDLVREFFRDNPPTPDNPVSIGFEGTLGYIPCRATHAILRIGYLAAFRQWGYGYILSPAAQVIRRIIADYENPPRELGRIVLRNVSPSPTRSLQFVLFNGGLAILVVMRLIAEAVPYHYGVFMPSRMLDPDKVLYTLADAAEVLRQRRPAAT